MRILTARGSSAASRVITLWSLSSIARHPAAGVCRLLYFVFGLDEVINSTENLFMLETVVLFPQKLPSSAPHIAHIARVFYYYFGQLFIICATVENEQLRLLSVRERGVSSWSKVAYLLSISI